MNKLMQAAGLIQQVGSRGSPDTLLAHITPREAELLKARGGSGRIDPNTGLPHFEDDGDNSYGSNGGFSGSGWGDDSGDAHSTSGNSDGYSNVGGWGGASGDAYGRSPYGSSGQSYEPMRPDQYKTLGGMLMDSMGYDPQGVGAMIGNGLVSALGYVNPVLGMAGKVAQAYVKSQSPTNSDGNGSMNFIGHLTGSNLLSRLTSGSPVAMDSSQPADAPRKAQSGSSYQSGSSSRANNGRRKKPWIEE